MTGMPSDVELNRLAQTFYEASGITLPRMTDKPLIVAGLRAVFDAHLRATGPARDEGLRARIEAVVRSSWYEVAVGRVVLESDLRAALAASPAPGGDRWICEADDCTRPRVGGSLLCRWHEQNGEDAPGGDTAPREDDEPETLVPNRLLALLVGVDHCEHAADHCCHDCMTKAMDRGLSLLEAARPVPPGPAATRDEEAILEEITNRDAAIEWADRLAYAIAPVSVIGEHSSHNDPWVNALEIAEQLNRPPEDAREGTQVEDTPDEAASTAVEGGGAGVRTSAERPERLPTSPEPAPGGDISG